MSKEKPLIKVKKEIDKGLANARQKVRVTISVNNVGNAPAYDVEIEDLLPKGLELVSSVETFTKVNVIEPQGSYIRSFDVTSKTARRYRLPPTTVAYYKKKGLFRGKSYHAKSTGNPSISFEKKVKILKAYLLEGIPPDARLLKHGARPLKRLVTMQQIFCKRGLSS